MSRLTGIPAAPGVAVGPVWRYVGHHLPVRAGAAAHDLDVLALAEQAARELERLAADLRADGRHEEALIFDAHALMARDPTLLTDIGRRVERGQPVAEAIREASGAAAETLAALDDDLFAARAADVRDVGARMVRLVTGERVALPAEPSIVVGHDLPPSVTAEIPAGLLLGIALERGSRTAHAVILARSLGVPAVVGVAGLLDALAAGGRVALDGGSGAVIIEPSAREVDALQAAAAPAARGSTTRAPRTAQAPLRGHRGRPIRLLANWSSERDTERALAAGAEGIGLYRTEFLFMGRSRPPSEDEQVAAYRAVLEAFGPGRPVVIRLVDIGGDKQLPYLGMPADANPFLGMRALRLAGRHRELLVTQLRAVSTAAALARVAPHVMAPMVGTLDDVELLLALRDEAQSGLAAERRLRAERFVTGIMVEVPAAALLAPELARHVDFFSIGTNDLTQYLMAADRTNPELAPLQDALHPAVLRAVALIVDGARDTGIPVAVCGELAGDPAGAVVLAALGIDELSADPAALDGIRATLGAVARPDLDALAPRVLAARDGAAVRALVDPLLAGG